MCFNKIKKFKKGHFFSCLLLFLCFSDVSSLEVWIKCQRCLKLASDLSIYLFAIKSENVS